MEATTKGELNKQQDHQQPHHRETTERTDTESEACLPVSSGTAVQNSRAAETSANDAIESAGPMKVDVTPQKKRSGEDTKMNSTGRKHMQFNSPVPIEQRRDSVKMARKEWTIRGVHFEEESSQELED